MTGKVNSSGKQIIPVRSGCQSGLRKRQLSLVEQGFGPRECPSSICPDGPYQADFRHCSGKRDDALNVNFYSILDNERHNMEVAGVEPASWSVDQEPLQVYPPVQSSAGSVGGGNPLPARACFDVPNRSQAHGQVSPGLLQAPLDARYHAPGTRRRVKRRVRNLRCWQLLFCHF